jgi:glycosyltransferase involved in cell wall biosynthesis
MAPAGTPILVLAYHFPPVGGGGVQRNAKFIRYLQSYGYSPTVITGPGHPFGHWTPHDGSMLDEIGGTTPVFRTSGPEPAVAEGRRAAIERRLLVKSDWTRWWERTSVETGAKAAPKDVKLLYASVVPYDLAEPAARLARELGVPWVADLQDPWALDETWLYPSTAHRALDRRRMRRLLGTAAAIVMNTPEAKTRLLASFPELSARLVVSIPNGFDESDYSVEPVSRDHAKFRIVHTGYLHTDQGLRLREMRRWRKLLGGTLCPIDVLTRSHVFLLEAIAELIAADPSLTSKIEVVLAGTISEGDRRIADKYPFVTLTGYVSHETSVSYILSADLLFLPMHDLAPGTRAGLVPGKTYEYLGSGRPILAAVPDGDARDLLQAAGSASLCRPADVDAMKRILREHINRWKSGATAPPPDPRVLAEYERRALTKRLAGVFDALIGASRLESDEAQAPVGATKTAAALRA